MVIELSSWETEVFEHSSLPAICHKRRNDDLVPTMGRAGTEMNDSQEDFQYGRLSHNIVSVETIEKYCRASRDR